MPNKWFSVFLGFLLPPLAFVYLARFNWAIIYFLLLIIAAASDFYLNTETGYSGLSILLAIVCCVHAFRTSKKITFTNGRKWYSHWWGALSIPVLFISAIFLFRCFLYEPFRIPSKSMHPTLQIGNHIVVSKFAYGRYGSFGTTIYEAALENRRKPERGEIFVFQAPHQKVTFVKRIIGLPNDRIVFSNKQLFINGQAINTRQQNGVEMYEENIGKHTYTVQYSNDNGFHRSHEITVPENAYFVMGDNRDNSADSRAWGMVPAKNIIGKVVVVW